MRRGLSPKGLTLVYASLLRVNPCICLPGVYPEVYPSLCLPGVYPEVYPSICSLLVLRGFLLIPD